MSRRADFRIGDVAVRPGSRVTLDLPVAQLFIHSPINLPVHVIHGKRDGPVLFVSAAVHGDEINGVEVIRRLLELRTLNRLRGTLICIPIVNVFGFLENSRYLPDRRDLNRSFPGSESGSLAARLAHLFVTEIVQNSDYGIDLHTAAGNRENLPQVRADLSDAETRELAAAFGAPVVIDSSLRDGSLRASARELGVRVIVYEAGEALRFNDSGIRAGVRGILHVLRHLGMLPAGSGVSRSKSVYARNSAWTRAPASGICRARVKLGDRVREGQKLCSIAGPFGENPVTVEAKTPGIVIGLNHLPLVNEGDALFHIARFDSAGDARRSVLDFNEAMESLEEFERDIWRR